MTERDLKSLSRGTSRDMSPAAIARRLEIVSELRDLAMTLATARRIDQNQPDFVHSAGQSNQTDERRQACGTPSEFRTPPTE